MPRDEIRLVHNNRGFYDVWVNDSQLAEMVHSDDMGDLSTIFYQEIGRQGMREAMKREGLQ